MKSIIHNLWKLAKGLVVRDLDVNFFSHADKDYVLNEGLWAFHGHIFLLKHMIRLESPSEVKAYDVPSKKQTTPFGRQLASNIEIDISKQLQRAINVIMVTEKPIWFRFKFVKRLDFRYGCGKLGHVLKGSKTIEGKEGDPNLQYGAWLRTSPLGSRRYSAEY
ncbi:hypothetical protein Cgig2_003206 [Carnegiea gigantea]|uniref:DUF4283 domain-containing protein n=1 Tax=Carnegiea gigantea TaxID=171969 RepID=A0A9Q1K4A0_9CARY|nr:hypothetical protein Cgig2_003206 [Carnegiea gigantea]